MLRRRRTGLGGLAAIPSCLGRHWTEEWKLSETTGLAVHRGSCQCRAITFEVQGDLAGPDACHCGKCRKHSGHFFASTDVLRLAVTIRGQNNVTWYQSSDKARRGFCSICGSSLFWDPLFRDWIGVAMGTFDTPTNTHLAVHIFVADKGDYYEVDDGVRQFQQLP